MDGINTWWEQIPGERFWLGVTGSDGDMGAVLAAPCGSRHHASSWPRALITHVRDGDAVFHYDEARQAIVAWSIARGRAQRRPLVWSVRARDVDVDAGSGESRSLPSWVIGLERATPLDGVVPLDQVARVQWDLFPALRDFEDQVGEPLYYPFAMGGPSATRLLAGYVFKLPTLFVERFPALAQVGERMDWSVPGRMRVVGRPGVGVERITRSPEGRIAPTVLHSTPLMIR